nr:ORF3 [Torque teno felis virus]
MSDDRNPEGNTLRGMLARRAIQKQEKRPKRVKRTRTGKKKSDTLLDALKEILSVSSLSAGESTSSSNAW